MKRLADVGAFWVLLALTCIHVQGTLITLILFSFTSCISIGWCDHSVFSFRNFGFPCKYVRFQDWAMWVFYVLLSQSSLPHAFTYYRVAEMQIQMSTMEWMHLRIVNWKLGIHFQSFRRGQQLANLSTRQHR